jgi:hypothetical protein
VYFKFYNEINHLRKTVHKQKCFYRTAKFRQMVHFIIKRILWVDFVSVINSCHSLHVFDVTAGCIQCTTKSKFTEFFVVSLYEGTGFSVCKGHIFQT